MSQIKTNQQNKIKQTLNNKGNIFAREKTSKRTKIVGLRFGAFFVRSELFRKKKKKPGFKLS